jgi:hypothetical protein
MILNSIFIPKKNYLNVQLKFISANKKINSSLLIYLQTILTPYWLNIHLYIYKPRHQIQSFNKSATVNKRARRQFSLSEYKWGLSLKFNTSVNFLCYNKDMTLFNFGLFWLNFMYSILSLSKPRLKIYVKTYFF